MGCQGKLAQPAEFRAAAHSRLNCTLAALWPDTLSKARSTTESFCFAHWKGYGWFALGYGFKRAVWV